MRFILLAVLCVSLVNAIPPPPPPPDFGVSENLSTDDNSTKLIPPALDNVTIDYDNITLIDENGTVVAVVNLTENRTPVQNTTSTTGQQGAGKNASVSTPKGSGQDIQPSTETPSAGRTMLKLVAVFLMGALLALPVSLIIVSQKYSKTEQTLRMQVQYEHDSQKRRIRQILPSYIMQLRQNGMTDYQIKMQLLSHGFDRDTVEGLLR